MSVLHALSPHALATACAALDWPWESTGALLMDSEGHALPCDIAHDIAFCARSPQRASSAQRASARAVLGEFGLPHDPADLPTGPEDSLIDTDRSTRSRPATSDAEWTASYVAHARELLEDGCSPETLIDALSGPFRDDPDLPAGCIATAAAIALGDPIRPR